MIRYGTLAAVRPGQYTGGPHEDTVFLRFGFTTIETGLHGSRHRCPRGGLMSSRRSPANSQRRCSSRSYEAS